MLAALELNDQALLMQAEDGAMQAEPGFARLTPEGIETGEAARAVAWREPHHVYNQYWCHLNQTPLAARERWARHHGDIAFAQLRKLWHGTGQPDQVMILAPGSMSDAQLSLVLGMVAALPAEVCLVIDSGLAGCLPVDRETLHVDTHLHQTVLTVCRPEGEVLRIVEQEVFPALGMLQIQNAVARHVSNLMIENFRYDPLHASDSEQAIYDRIPAWLMKLGWEREVSDTLTSEHGPLPMLLQKKAVQHALGERLDQLRVFMGRHAEADRLLSHGTGVLRGLADALAGTSVAAQSASTEQCLAHQVALLGGSRGLHRTREVGRIGPVARRADTNARLATHILYRDRAMPLHTPVSIHLDDGVLRLSGEMGGQAALTLVVRNGSLEALSRREGLEASLPRTGRPGETIVVEGHRLRLIEISDA